MQCSQIIPKQTPEDYLCNGNPAFSSCATWRSRVLQKWSALRDLLVVLIVMLTFVATPSHATNNNTNRTPGVEAIPKYFNDLCRERLATTTEVTLRTRPTIYRFSDSLDVLLQKSGSGSGLEHIPLGLTESSRSVQLRWNQRNLMDRKTGQMCASIDLHIDIDLPAQIVSVAKELPRGTCSFNFVLEHELKHVYANEETAKRAADTARKVLSKKLDGHIFYADNEERLNLEIKSYLQYQIQRWVERLLNQAIELHKVIDSPHEYEKTNDVCDQAIPKLLTRYRLQNNSRRVKQLDATRSH